jgi:hypothetical protein
MGINRLVLPFLDLYFGLVTALIHCRVREILGTETKSGRGDSRTVGVDRLIRPLLDIDDHS